LFLRALNCSAKKNDRLVFASRSYLRAVTPAGL
jgi:hypothetical protein